MLIPSDLPWHRSAPESKPQPEVKSEEKKDQAPAQQGQSGGEQDDSPTVPAQPQVQPEQQEPQNSQAAAPAPTAEQPIQGLPSDQPPQEATPPAKLDPPAARQAPTEQAPSGPTVVVRYGQMNNVGEFRHNLSKPPRFCQKVVVRTERGVEIGQVVSTVCGEQAPLCLTGGRLGEYLAANGPEYPFKRGGKVLRLANTQDLIEQRHLEGSAREAAIYCRQQIRELNLSMKLVTVEYLLGGEKIIFYFSSEARVDFRELVRRLANQYRTRVEMRQVGSRDEARLVGDYERCGQRCCCQQYLKDLKPVSMRMAKVQKATLDPTKISGRCGRLMCCLRYEDDVYSELRTKLPRKNTWIRTEKHLGRVVDGQILTQLVRIALPDGEQIVVANEEILERDVPAPPLPQGEQPGQQQARGQLDRQNQRSRGKDRSGRQQQPRQNRPAGEVQKVQADAGADAEESDAMPDEAAMQADSFGDESMAATADVYDDLRGGDEMDDGGSESDMQGGELQTSEGNEDFPGQSAQPDAGQPQQQNQQPRQQQNNQRPQDQQFRNNRGRGRRRRRDRNRRPSGPQQNQPGGGRPQNNQQPGGQQQANPQGGQPPSPPQGQGN